MNIVPSFLSFLDVENKSKCPICYNDLIKNNSSITCQNCVLDGPKCKICENLYDSIELILYENNVYCFDCFEYAFSPDSLIWKLCIQKKDKNCFFNFVEWRLLKCCECDLFKTKSENLILYQDQKYCKKCFNKKFNPSDEFNKYELVLKNYIEENEFDDDFDIANNNYAEFVEFNQIQWY